MTRKIAPLTAEHLEELTAPCRACLFWEQDPVRRGRTDDPGAAKVDWVTDVLREWGPCGQVALVDGVPVGYVAYAPEVYVPGAAGFPTAPISADAVLLTAAYVAPAHAGGGIGRMLVQRMARDLVQREIRAVEAFGDTRGRASCLTPVDFLGSVGFTTLRAHSTTPRMRMDLRTAVPWRTPVGAALERLAKAVRPSPKPSPAAGPLTSSGPTLTIRR